LGNVPAAIEIEALVKRYGGHVALDGVTLRVPEGAVYGFLGPNGAGKTTTMRILLGLLRADTGTARVLGRDPWGDGFVVRGRIGYLPSGAGLYLRMHGRQVLDYFSGLDASPPSAAASSATRCGWATPTSTGPCAANFLLVLWEPTRDLARLTFFWYLSPGGTIQTGTVPWGDAAVLAWWSIAASAAAIAHFRRRDLV
jgi:hypothetical protein